MRRVLSTVLAVALLLGLGALAVLALPNANASLAGAPAVSAAAPEFAPDAPNATTVFNHIALPLKSQNQFTYTADGLLGYVPGAAQILHWDPANGVYQYRYSDQFGTNFALATGQTYWLELSNAAGTIVSFVGDVPAQGEIKFDLLGGTPCIWNEFSVPLDRSDITNADQLITALGGATDVEQVVTWDPANGVFSYRYADTFGTNFSVKIGYPYAVCMFTAKTGWH